MLENFLGNKTAWKILRLLSEAPGRGVSRAEIKKFTGAGNLALSNALEKLELYGIIKKKKMGKKEIFWINMANEFAKKLLDIFYIEKEKFKGMPPSKITFLAKVFGEIEKIRPKEVILFGSQVKGTATEQSDFDIAVIVERKSEKIVEIVSKLGDKVQLHIFEEKEFEELKKRKDPLVFEIIRDGIKII